VARGDGSRRFGIVSAFADEVRWNVRRGRRYADLAYRLRADAAAVSAAGERVATSRRANDYLETRQLREWWTTITDPSGSQPSAVAVRFTSALAVGLFLAHMRD